MSSSMQLAQECLEKEGDVPHVQTNTIEGLERFAQLIDNGKNIFISRKHSITDHTHAIVLLS